MVEVQSLEKGHERRIPSLLALGKVATVDDGNLYHNPEDHFYHPPDSIKHAFDKVEGQKICGIPRPEHWVSHFPSYVDKSIANADKNIACDGNHHKFEDNV